MITMMTVDCEKLFPNFKSRMKFTFIANCIYPFMAVERAVKSMTTISHNQPARNLAIAHK